MLETAKNPFRYLVVDKICFHVQIEVVGVPVHAVTDPLPGVLVGSREHTTNLGSVQQSFI